MGNAFRICVECFQPYPAGTWREHRSTHTTTQVEEVRSLLAKGLSQAEVARRLGVTRQRINAIVRRAA
jgi:transcriptional regulator